MRTRIIISLFLTFLAAIPALGQGRQVLTDGIAGRDRVERLQFIQAFSPASDTCLVMTDSLGCFEVDPELMDEMRVVAGQLVELLLHLLGRELVGA